MNDITLESLIQEHRMRLPYLRDVGHMMPYYEYPDMGAYHRWLAKTTRYIEIQYLNDKHVVEFGDVSKEKIYPDQQRKLLAILEAFAVLPTVIPDNRTTQVTEKKGKRKDVINVVTTINNTNSQSQNQEQSLAVELFIEAVKDDLNGRQIKELKAVVAEADNDLQKARPGVLAKLKEFGADVASNIVANLLTNPMIWGGL
ncbi:MAG: peptide chain release factor 1 [Alphaproteobacteria bacterium]|nr:peptide chain release factor 1 [Alphaproteobacteria bacterium]MBQ6872289.1 peptide chain release factor 1 [Bacteroidales bacterium]